MSVPRDESVHWKQFRDGTHRHCHPEQTFRRVAPFLPVMGITRVANVTGLDTIGIPVYMVVRPNSRSLAVAQGKGFTPAAAKISGVMESIETYHAERIDVSTRLGSLCDLAARYAVADMDQLSRSTYKKFDDQIRIPWLEAWDIVSERPVWVPYELVHTDYTLPLPFDGGYFIADTNGLASGNSVIEAMVHGLCEVVERDAWTLWALRSRDFQRQRRIALNTIEDERCREIVSRFSNAEVAIAVWDITTDIGLPVFVCKAVQPDRNDIRIRPAMGAGCHPNRGVALLRALTEAAQSRLTFIAGARDDQPLKNYQNFQEGASAAWIDEVIAHSGTFSFADSLHLDTEFVEDDLAHILAELSATGLRQVLCVNLTKPQFNIPVVKMIVPGLECHTCADYRIPGKRARTLMTARHEYA